MGDAVSLTKPVWKLEGAGSPIAKRIVLNGRIVALVLELSNGWWTTRDLEEKRIPGLTPEVTPARCMTAFKRSPAGRSALESIGGDHG